MILFSIIIPLFNSQKTILKSLKSITNQKFNDYEIIIINDASTDKSDEIIDKFKKDRSNIKKINLKKNRGVSYSRNIGIKYAAGRYIIFLDSDDHLIKNALVKISKKININKKIDILIANYSSYKIDNISTKDFKNNYKNKKIIHAINDINKFSGVVWRYIIRRDFLVQNNIKFKEGIKIKEDCLFVINLFLKSKSYLNTKILFYKYNYNRSSVMNNEYYKFTYSNAIFYFQLIIEISKILKKNQSLIGNKEKIFLDKFLNIFFYSFVTNSIFLKKNYLIKIEKNINIYKKEIKYLKRINNNTFFNIDKNFNFFSYLSSIRKQFLDNVPQNRNIIVFCQTLLGVIYCNLLKNKKKFLYLIDNNIKKQNKRFLSFNIKDINILKKIKNIDETSIILCHDFSNTRKKIIKQIKKINKNIEIIVPKIKFDI